MKRILILVFTLWALPSFAACADEFYLAAPTKHLILGCDTKPLTAYHFTVYDASHQAMSRREQGDYLNVQLKYTGDWTITPTRIQLVPYYLDQVRKFNGKLIFEDENLATYKFYRDDKTYWMELRFVGDGIHIIQTIEQNGIVLDAQYSVPQMKSRMKRYGKIVFYELAENTASQAALADFLKGDDRQFYIVGHNYDAADQLAKSTEQALVMQNILIELGVKQAQLISTGVGAVSPVKNPAGVNSEKKNTRIELVLRR